MQAATVAPVIATALLFGIIWTVVNFYNFYPLAQASVERGWARFWPQSDREEPVDTAEYPTLDVYVPAYEEGDVIESAISSIAEARYPQQKLTVYALTEPDDLDTQTALEQLSDLYSFEHLVVPKAYPGDPNKPRALNYAFEQSEGEYVAIVDAEDIIAPEFFEQIAHAAVRDGADYMQGRPDMVNEDDGWLNTLFRAEYGYWYNLIVPARTKVDFPVPLSGNTCAFSRGRLEQLSRGRQDRQGDSWTDTEWTWIRSEGLDGTRPWDPENVTEDFEIGLRLWNNGAEFSYLSAVTQEESPLDLNGWIKQRTRWKKGKLYTANSFRKDPPGGIRASAHLFWQSLLPHLGPINITGLVIVLMIGNLLSYRPGPIIATVLTLGVTFAVIVSVLFGVGYWSASDAPLRTRIRRVVVVALTVPLYWLLQWGADLRALVQTYNGQFHWEHTDHFGRNGEDVVVNGGERSIEDLTREYTLSTRTRVVALGGIIALGSALRGFELGSWSLWLDEVYTVAGRGAMPITEALVLPTDPHPPLYYLLMHGWMDTVGSSEALVRLPSLLFAIATLIVVYRLGIRIYNDRIGLAAAALLAITPFHVHFARVARMYAMFGFLTACSWYCLLGIRKDRRLALVGYILATSAMVYTHVYAAFVVLAQLVVLALLGRENPLPTRKVITAVCGVGVLSVPWVALLASRVIRMVGSNGSSNIQWIPQPSSIALGRTALTYVGYPDYYPFQLDSVLVFVVAAGVLFAFVGLAIASAFHSSEGIVGLDIRWTTGALAVWLVTPVAVPFIISQAVPVFAPRYTLPASIPVYLLAAKGLDALPTRRLGVVMVGVVVVGSLFASGVYLDTSTAEDWAGAAENIERDGDPGDLLVFQPGYIGRGDDSAFNYYYDGPEMDRVTIRGEETAGASEYEAVEAAARPHETVWLITYFGASERTNTVIEDSHREVAVTVDGAITVKRYERKRRMQRMHLRV
jgi:uncharacterized membrane protein/cellulose synthase/poly-beta-1,6-N-acetylglucosamine synthase-like glycosyltransferase